MQFDLRTMRKIGEADVNFNATPNTAIIVNIKNTNRDGHIPYGGTFGFSNAVEIPMPLDKPGADGRLLQVTRLPSAAIPAGTYEFKVVVFVGNNKVERTTTIVLTD